MTQFDPSMVAEMLMSPIRRASENLGGGPMGIGADAGGSYFVDPEVAGRTGYGTAVTGTSFFPGAGIVDAAGGAVDITGQTLPSFGENIREGQFTDAGLQALGVAGDIATIAAPLTGGATALLGAMMKAPRAAQKSSAIFNSVDRFPNLSKGEESLVAASSAPDEEIAGLGKVVVEKVDSNDLEGSRKRFKELKDLTANYKQDRAKARLIKLDTGEDAIQYMQPPTEVTTLNISDLTATQSDVVLGGDASLSDTMPLVVKKEGKFFIRDGHHRLAQKAISGESSAEVRLVDLDKGADVASDVSKVIETPKSIEQTLSQKYPDIDLSVFENQNGLTLSKIVVPENQRSEGIGTKVMDDLIDYADKNNLSIGVTPDATFGGSKTRLESFYKKFGFVRNKGRNKDFTFRETFVRQPKDSD